MVQGQVMELEDDGHDDGLNEDQGFNKEKEKEKEKENWLKTKV
jgi:hypothetical protein